MREANSFCFILFLSLRLQKWQKMTIRRPFIWWIELSQTSLTNYSTEKVSYAFSISIIWFVKNRAHSPTSKLLTISNVRIFTQMILISSRREKTKIFCIVKARDSIEDISFKNGIQKQNKIKKSMNKSKINKPIPSIIKLVNLLSKMNLKFLINLKILILMISLTVIN